MGYPSKYAISNLGAIFIYFILAFCLLLTLYAIMRIASKTCGSDGKVLKYARNFKAKIKWNGAIQFFNELYLCLSVSVAINMLYNEEALQFDTFGHIFNSLFAIASAVSLIIVPCIICYALVKYWAPAIKEANYYKKSASIIFYQRPTIYEK